ncbi:BTAD domain-containing putative transcriptional regulator [Micromonospora coriariae]|uniref:BTAD domain-containing putative transcriptional regulator n=1 Tax=Micromonospora coriariae TaxID=285665 RepID=UPI0022B265D1|nr:BTAD domain-containing putative transcriptional regulator [Micromonospora coriariae]
MRSQRGGCHRSAHSDQPSPAPPGTQHATRSGSRPTADPGARPTADRSRPSANHAPPHHQTATAPTNPRRHRAAEPRPAGDDPTHRGLPSPGLPRRASRRRQQPSPTTIWPGLPAHTVTARLYTTLSDLRKAVTAVSDAPLIEHTGDRYRLRRDHIEVDLWRFHAAVEHAATAVTARPAAWQAVINAHTGNLAAEHDWPWLNPPREALRRHVIDAYTALAATQPNPRRTLSLLQDAIRVDPYNENLHRRAIHALEALGDHAAAEDLLTTFNRRLTDAGMEHVIPHQEVRTPRAASSGQKH